jgi:protein-disulfide isomerase/uncharacterized membrane protein
MKNKGIISISILSILGIIDSYYTLLIHSRLEKSSIYRSFCTISEFINCDVVIASKYGKFLGIHNSVYGIFLYSILFIYAMYHLVFAKEKQQRFYSYVFAISIFTSLYSIYLFTVSILIIKALCLMCTGIYIINLSMFLIVLVVVLREKITPFMIILNDLAYLYRKNPLLLFTGILLLITTFSYLYYSHIIREKQMWRMQYADILSGSVAEKSIEIKNSPAQGNPQARVTIVEFSDFQCPYCKNAHRTLKNIFRHYGENIRIVFKHFPLDRRCNLLINRTIHENACGAAIAAICAEEQGKFFEYVDMLFEHQEDLREENLINLAEKLNLHMEKFNACLKEPGERIQTIVTDVNQGFELGVRSTPTLFINGKMIKGAIPEWLLREIIDRELK